MSRDMEWHEKVKRLIVKRLKTGYPARRGYHSASSSIRFSREPHQRHGGEGEPPNISWSRFTLFGELLLRKKILVFPPVVHLLQQG